MKEEALSLQKRKENKRKMMKSVMIGNWIINLENCTHVSKEVVDGKHLLHFANLNNTQNSWDFSSEEELNKVFNQIWTIISGENKCLENATSAESTP